MIIDEYDHIISKNLFGIYNETINGFWSFKAKNVYAFSATSSKSMERLVSKVVSLPQKLVFDSEYEFLNGVSPF